MRNTTHTHRANPGVGSGALNTSIGSVLAGGIDPVTMAHLDVSLFRSLRKIGHSRERICSALCLSYAEYDSILSWLESEAGQQEEG